MAKEQHRSIDYQTDDSFCVPTLQSDSWLRERERESLALATLEKDNDMHYSHGFTYVHYC